MALTLPNIFRQAGVKTALELDDLDEVEPTIASHEEKLRNAVQPPAGTGVAEPARSGMKTSGIRQTEAEEVAREKARPAPSVPVQNIPGAAALAGQQPAIVEQTVAARAAAPPKDTLQDRQKLPALANPRLDELGDLDRAAQARLSIHHGVGVSAGENPHGQDMLNAFEDRAQGLVAGSEDTSRALAEDARAKDALAGDQAKLLPDAADQLVRARTRAMRMASQLDQVSGLYRDAVERGVDPDRLFGSGRLTKAMAIAAHLGQSNQLYSTGIQAPDTMALIESEIDKDLRAQELDIANKGDLANNLLHQYQVALGDKDVAADAFRLTWLDLVKARMEALVPRLQDAQQKQAMLAALGELEQDRSQFLVDFADKQLDRKLEAAKATATNLTHTNTVAAKLAAEQEGLDWKAMTKFTNDREPAIGSIKTAQRLMGLMNDAQERFGHIPGIGNLVAAEGIEGLRKYVEALTSGAEVGVAPSERRMALEIAQAAHEWEYQQAQAIKGTPSDYDVALNKKVYGAFANKDATTGKNLVERYIAETRNAIVRSSVTALPPRERLRYLQANGFQDYLPPNLAKETPADLPSVGPYRDQQRL